MRALTSDNPNAVKPRIKKEVEKEYARRYQEHQDQIQQDIAVQLTAAIFYTLAINEGWKKKRLKRLMNEITGTFSDMEGVGFAGAFDTDDVVEYVKQQFDIDLKSEIKCSACRPKK